MAAYWEWIKVFLFIGIPVLAAVAWAIKVQREGSKDKGETDDQA